MSELERQDDGLEQAAVTGLRPANTVPASDDHRQEEALLAAVRLTRMPMALTDPTRPDNPLVYVNPAFRELTGYDEREVLGRNCRFLQGPGTDQTTVRQVRDALGRHESISTEIYNYRRDGSGFWNALYICPIFDTGGRLVQFFASQMDVTKLKEAERRQRQHLDAVGSLAAGVAHTFNNLMTIVLAGIDQAARQSVGETQRLQLARAEQATRSAGRLTQQMLSFAQRQFLQAQVVDLNSLVAELDDLVGQMAGQGIAVEFRLAAHPIPARLDPGQFALALIAIMRNAADALPAGGRIIVATRQYRSWNATRRREGREWVELAVADAGQGMPPEVAQQATEPFYSTKPNGTGLGLSAVAGYVEQSGGRLAIESQPGRGTTVRMAFPRHRAPD